MRTGRGTGGVGALAAYRREHVRGCEERSSVDDPLCPHLELGLALQARARAGAGARAGARDRVRLRDGARARARGSCSLHLPYNSPYLPLTPYISQYLRAPEALAPAGGTRGATTILVRASVSVRVRGRGRGRVRVRVRVRLPPAKPSGGASSLRGWG